MATFEDANFNGLQLSSFCAMFPQLYGRFVATSKFYALIFAVRQRWCARNYWWQLAMRA